MPNQGEIVMFRCSLVLCAVSYVTYLWLLFGQGGNELKHVVFGIHLAAIILTVLVGVVPLFQKRAVALIPILAVMPLLYLQFLS